MIKNFPAQIDGILLTKRENIRWVSGFDGSFGLVLLFKTGKNILITDSRYAEIAKKNLPKNWKFVLFDKNFKKKFSTKIFKKLWIEDSTKISEFKYFKKLFRNVRFLSKNQFIENLRRQKTNQEIEKIKTAQTHIDDLLIKFLKTKLKIGITEAQLAFELDLAIRDGGKFGISFDTIVAFGKNSAIPHHYPSSKKLEKNKNILIDCGAKFGGYCSDMTRNFVFGSPSQEYRKKFENCFNAQKQTLAKYQENIKISELEKYCRQKLGNDEKYFTHSLGHGVGLEIHELPKVSVSSKKRLLDKEVVTCEPGIYFPEKFGIRIEDLVLINKNKIEILSKTPKDLICFDRKFLKV